MTTDEISRSGTRSGQIEPAVVLRNVADALVGLKFGQIVVTVHDGNVVQIERIERTRLQHGGGVRGRPS
jgi:hypothetical protein